MLIFLSFIKWSVFSLRPPKKSMSQQVRSNPSLQVKLISISFPLLLLMLGKGRPNVWAYNRYATNAPSYHIYNNYFHGSQGVYLVNTSHFLVLPQYYSTFGGAMRLSSYENLMNCYHKKHGIRDFFHDHVLVLIHVHEFGTILHSLLGMVQIQLDETGYFSSTAHYFVQQQENMILIQNIL